MKPSTTPETDISEIFSSIQGEGLLAGERHLFIRFKGCHLHCQYCDERDKEGRLMGLDEVLTEVDRLNRVEGPHSYVSLTGGEPLMNLDFLLGLIPSLKGKGFRIYLESNGVLWENLSEIIGQCDYIAMDMKLASVTGEMDYYSAHQKYLNVASKCRVFVKMILSRDVDVEEYRRKVEMISEVDQSIPLVLQPVTFDQSEGYQDAECMKILLNLQKWSLHKLNDVRIMPRLHRILRLP